MYASLHSATEPPFQEKELNGHRYRVALGVKQKFKLGLAHWHPRKTELLPLALGHEVDPNDPIKNPVLDHTEVIEATPYLESEGARDTGKAFLWAEYRINAGRGIVAVPYEGWSVDDNLLQQDTGTIKLIATEDFQHVLDNPGGFVLVEPAEGWKNVPDSIIPSLDDLDSQKKTILAIGLGVALVAGATYLLRGR